MKKINLQRFANLDGYIDMDEVITDTPELMLEAFPALAEIINTDYLDAIGDTITFTGLKLTNMTIDVDQTPGSPCAGANVVCPGLTTDSIVLNMDKMYNDAIIMDRCEIAKIERLGRENGIGDSTNLVNKFKAIIDKEYLMAELVKVMSKELLPQLTIVDTAAALGTDEIAPTDLFEETQSAIGMMEELNPNLAGENYTQLITKSYYRQNIVHLRGRCCELLTLKQQYTDRIEWDTPYVIVPDSWLFINNVQYDCAIYLRKFLVYWFRCAMAEFSEGTNEFKGKLFYHKRKKWSAKYANFDTCNVNSMGIIYKSRFGKTKLGVATTPVGAITGYNPHKNCNVVPAVGEVKAKETQEV